VSPLEIRPIKPLAMWLTLIFIGVLVVWIRVRLLAMPLERDEGEYAYMGQLLLQGIPPYRNAFNMKLPGTYGAYALFQLLFGETERGLRIGLLFVNLATIASIFVLARRLFDARAALWGTAAFALTSQSGSLLGLSGAATHFINLAIVPGFLLLVYALDARQLRAALLRYFAAGLCFGLGFLMKQQAIFLVATAFGWLLIALRQKRREDPHNDALVNPALASTNFVLGVMLPYAFLCAALVASGDFSAFWFWTVEYARAYTQLVDWLRAAYYLISRCLEWAPDWPMTLAALAGFWVALRRHSRHRAFLGMWALGATLSVVPGFYFRPHYFLTLLPVLALSIAAGAHYLHSRADLGTRRVWFQAVGVLIFLFYAANHFAVWRLSAVDYIRSVYRVEPFEEAREIAAFLRKNSGPSDKIAVLGSEPQIYFYARRRAATGYLYAYPLMENQPYALQMQKQMANEIEKAQPRWIVFENGNYAWGETAHSPRFIVHWFEKFQRQYQRVAVIEFSKTGHTWKMNPPDDYKPATFRVFTLWKRKDVPSP
jgi:4-amino-4-deoxy-L-arabinose transferase-like glycosyltransferase